MEPRVVATGVGFCEGPVWTQDGRLVFVSIDHGTIYKAEDGGRAATVATPGGGCNGLTEGAAGVLYVAQSGVGSESAAEPGIQVVRDGTVEYVARGLDAPNDLCFGPDGRLYFTDPRGPVRADIPPGQVYALAEGGEPELLLEGPAFTNGIAFGPDRRDLYVAETLRARVLRYRLDGGRVSEPEVFCTTEPGFPDGMCFDDEGRLYVACTMARAVLVFDAAGARLDSLPCGESSLPTNCCFGGAQGTTLFVTDSWGARVLAFEAGVRGLPLFPFRRD